MKNRFLLLAAQADARGVNLLRLRSCRRLHYAARTPGPGPETAAPALRAEPPARRPLNPLAAAFAAALPL